MINLFITSKWLISVNLGILLALKVEYIQSKFYLIFLHIINSIYVGFYTIEF